MEKKYCYEYPHAAITADGVVFKYLDGNIYILLIERKNYPFAGCWALPGGFLEMEETVEACAHRELKEETSLEGINLHEYGIFSTVNRDPRERVVTAAFWGVLSPQNPTAVAAADDAAQAQWFNIENLPKLAFDHDLVIERALQSMREQCRFQPFVFEFLDATFSIKDLARIYSILLGKHVCPRGLTLRSTRQGIVTKASNGLYTFNPNHFTTPEAKAKLNEFLLGV